MFSIEMFLVMLHPLLAKSAWLNEACPVTQIGQPVLTSTLIVLRSV